MRKIINVRRNRNDTMMYFVVHDSDSKSYRVWSLRDPDEGLTHLERSFKYDGVHNSNDEVAARIQAKHLARDLSDAA